VHRSLGVHLSFVRSTTLDSWAADQLALAAVGGNLRARTFFKQHGWDDVGADKIEAKYTSRAAQLYRRQLEKDAAKLLAGGDADAIVADSSTSGKPAAAAPSNLVAANTAARAAAVGAKSRLPPTRRPGAAGRAGAGARRAAAAAVDESLFEQAPEEAAPEAPAAALESMDAEVSPLPASSRFNLDAIEEKTRAAPARGKDGHLTLSASDDFFSDPMGSNVGRKDSLDGGNGVSGVGGSSARAGSGRPGAPGGRRGAAPPPPPADSGAAQQRFGNAKSISSASYFNTDTKESEYERQGKIAQFQGSTSISSDAYFGRASASSGGGGGGGGAGGSLDAAAAELVSKIGLTARQDVEQLKAMASEAASKMSSLAQSFMRDLQGGY
jgi:ADP-ribosylation factor GTPase-activating protein 2/3